VLLLVRLPALAVVSPILPLLLVVLLFLLLLIVLPFLLLLVVLPLVVPPCLLPLVVSPVTIVIVAVVDMAVVVIVVVTGRWGAAALVGAFCGLVRWLTSLHGSHWVRIVVFGVFASHVVIGYTAIGHDGGQWAGME